MPGRIFVLHAVFGCKLPRCVCYRLFCTFLLRVHFALSAVAKFYLGHGASVLRTRSVEKHVAKRITGLRKAGWAQAASAVESQGSTGCAPARLQSAAIAMTLGPLFGRSYFRSLASIYGRGFIEAETSEGTAPWSRCRSVWWISLAARLR